MALINEFILDIDLKRDNFVDKPIIRQNDDALFRINIYDDDVPYDLSRVVTFTLSVTRPDDVTVISVGQQTVRSQATFSLPRSSVAIVGEMVAIVQMYDEYNRVSTFSFPIEVTPDPSDYIPKDEEKTLIEIVLGEGPAVIAEAKEATLEAWEAAEEARLAADEAESAIEGIGDVIDEVVEVRDTTIVVRDETIVAKNETEAASAYALEQAMRAEAAADGYDASNLVQYKGDYNPDTTYDKGNFVSYNGSSYVARQETTGNLPTDVVYWGLLAQRGVDGTGSVVSVNGIFPDLDGNVVLDIVPPDVDGLVKEDALASEDGAGMVGIDDVGDYYEGLTVQEALQEIGFTFNGARVSLINSVNEIGRL